MLYSSQKVLEQLEAPRKNDLIRVWWHDACRFERQKHLGPDVYVTVVPTTVHFHRIEVDAETGIRLLILSEEESKNSPSDGYLIPVPTIIRIEIKSSSHCEQSKKLPLLMTKTHAGSGVKIIERVVKLGR